MTDRAALVREKFAFFTEKWKWFLQDGPVYHGVFIDEMDALAALVVERIEALTLAKDTEIEGLRKALGEKDKVLKVAKLGLRAVEDLIAQSRAVSGLHLNGDEAPWEELRTGGQYEAWLLPFDEALAALAARPETPEALARAVVAVYHQKTPGTTETGCDVAPPCGLCISVAQALAAYAAERERAVWNEAIRVARASLASDADGVADDILAHAARIGA